MGYIQFVIAALALIIFFIIGVPAGIIVWIVTKINPAKGQAMASEYVRFGLYFVGGAIGCKVNVVGKENIPVGRAALYTSNHRSILDIVYTCREIPGPYTAVAKKELANVPFLHFWMLMLHCMFLDRENIKAGVQMVNDAVDLLKGGVSVFICPEGTRNHDEGTLLDFHGGSFKIAIRSNAPVVPVTVVHSGQVLERLPWITRTNVTVVFDPPIETEGMSIPDRKALPGRVKEIIQNNLERYA